MYHYRRSPLTGLNNTDFSNAKNLEPSSMLSSNLDAHLDFDVEKSVHHSYYLRNWRKRYLKFIKSFESRSHFYELCTYDIKRFINKWNFLMIFVIVTILVTFNQISANTYYYPNTRSSYLEIDKSTNLSRNEFNEIEIRNLNDEFNKSPKYNYNDVDKRFDLRVTPSLYLNNILNNLADNGNTLDEQFKFSLSWLDWINFDE